MAFSPGDLVQLKSGGAAMTVVAESDEGVRCIFFSEAVGDIKIQVIPAICLDAIELDDEIYEIEDLEEEDEDGEVAEEGHPVQPLPPARKKRN